VKFRPTSSPRDFRIGDRVCYNGNFGTGPTQVGIIVEIDEKDRRRI
jgi:hypothetical protein